MVIIMRTSEYSSWGFRALILFLSMQMFVHIIFGQQRAGDLTKCETVEQCRHVCGKKAGTLDLTPPLCDRNGTCICDCSNKTLIDSNPVPPPCATWIDSMQHDKCSEYCSNVYKRPSKICGEVSPVKKIFCTCLCKWY